MLLEFLIGNLDLPRILWTQTNLKMVCLFSFNLSTSYIINFGISVLDEPEVVEKRKRRPRGSKPKSRSLSPVPDFAPPPGDDYDYDGDEHYFDSKVIPLPFENMTEFESCFTLMPPGEKRFGEDL